MTDPHGASKIRAKAIGVVFLALVAGFATLGAENPGAPGIKSTVRAAISDVRDAGTYKTPGWTSGHLDAANLKTTHATLKREMSEHFTGAALDRWKGMLDTAIDRDSDGEHVIVTGGGVDKIAFDTVVVAGETATATGRAHTWITWVINKTGFAGPKRGRPSSWDSFEAHLVKVDGNWLVDDLSLIPVAGG